MRQPLFDADAAAELDFNRYYRGRRTSEIHDPNSESVVE
jgi:hypothetical protein